MPQYVLARKGVSGIVSVPGFEPVEAGTPERALEKIRGPSVVVRTSEADQLDLPKIVRYILIRVHWQGTEPTNKDDIEWLRQHVELFTEGIKRESGR